MLEKGDEIYGILDTTVIFEHAGYTLDDYSLNPVREYYDNKYFKIKRPNANLLMNVEQYWMKLHSEGSKYVVVDIIEINDKEYQICIPVMLNTLEVIEL